MLLFLGHLYYQNRQTVTWNFNGFLGMSAENYTNIRIMSFQATATNQSKKPIREFSTYVINPLTNETYKAFINLNGNLLLPEETNGIPSYAKFGISAPLVEHDANKSFTTGDGLTVEQFFAKIPELEFIFIYDGKIYKKKFDKKENKLIIEQFQNSMSERLSHGPAITRKKPNQRVNLTSKSGVSLRYTLLLSSSYACR